MVSFTGRPVARPIGLAPGEMEVGVPSPLELAVVKRLPV